MATITPTQAAQGDIRIYTWTGCSTLDTHVAVGPWHYGAAKRGVVTAKGTFGGGTLTLQGSLDNTNWFTVLDKQGNALSFTADGAEEFESSFCYFRPNMTGGAADNVDFVIGARP